MNTANIGPLLVKLNIDVAQGLFIVGADQIEETPFDLTGTLLVADLINDETALTNLTDVLKNVSVPIVKLIYMALRLVKIMRSAKGCR